MKSQDQSALKAYLKDIGRYPLLNKDETNALFARYNSKGIDRLEKARIKTKLVNSNLRLVVSIAKKYRDQGVPMIDLIQEGNVGLMKGVDRFDYTLGYRFSTYSSHWIKQAIRKYLTETARTVRLPAHIVDLVKRIRMARAEAYDAGRSMPSPKELAIQLNVTLDSVQAALDASGPTYTTDVLPEEQTGGSYKQASRSSIERHMHDSVHWNSESVDLDEVILGDQLRDIVKRGFADLTPREEQVMRLRFGVGEDLNSSEFEASEELINDLKERS